MNALTPTTIRWWRSRRYREALAKVGAVEDCLIRSTLIVG